MDDPAEVGLDPHGLVGDLGLCPGVADVDHQVTYDLGVELDHEGSLQRCWVLEVGSVDVESVRRPL
jgi:hypothetical protein